MIIRPERKEDYVSIYEVNKLAFGREEEAKLVDDLRELPDFIPKLSIVALEEEKVVGHILFTLVTIETKGGSIPALALAAMAVHPEFQNQGIGSQLINHGLIESTWQKYGIIVVIGHHEFYTRFGFTQAREKGLEVLFEVPDEAFMVREHFCRALDGVEGMIKYPEPFDKFI